MKSEHRHELKTNDLAKGLLTFQDYLKMYGGRAVLVIAIIACLVVLYFQRRNKAAEEEVKNRDDLAYAREQIDHLNYSARVAANASMSGEVPRLKVKPSDMGNVRKAILDVREKASDKAVQAEALLAQGDLAWALADFPDLPAAHADKTLQPDKDRDALRAEAKDAYQQVVNQFPDQPQRVIAAHVGLGVIAETARDWDEAKRQYEAIKSLPGATTGNKYYADAKLKNLEQLREPVLVGLVPEKAEKPPIPVDPAAAFELPDNKFGSATTPAATRHTTAPSTTQK